MSTYKITAKVGPGFMEMRLAAQNVEEARRWTMERFGLTKDDLRECYVLQGRRWIEITQR